MNRTLAIHTPHGQLYGQLEIPETALGLIILARTHHAPADAAIAEKLTEHAFAVLTMELLSSQEAHFVDATQNVPKLTQRLLEILDLIRRDGDMQNLPLAIFSIGDATPAVIRAAAQRDTQVRALASHGGLIDHAGLQALKALAAPLLMIVDAEDGLADAANQRAASYLVCAHETHVLSAGEDPVLAVITWFSRHFSG